MVPRLALTPLIVMLAVGLESGAVLAQAPVPAEAPATAPAQFDSPAYVAVVDGNATLERDGRIETSPLNMPLLSGDKVKTADGRVEVRFADGGRLLLDSRTSVDVLADDLVRLVDGRLRVTVVRAASSPVTYRIDSPAGSVRIFQPGDYRVALVHGPATSPGATADETQLEFAVTSGAGEISTEQGATPVRAGERAYASAGLLPSYTYSYNSAAGDDFDHWADRQREAVYQATSPSAQYLPSDMTNYSSTFDQYGDWQYQQSYGYVWYPHVAASWQPYYNGRWSSYPSYGWTWIAADPFGYPTHHYGRWGFSANAWFWIPSASWGPAYVSWVYAPNYVSWCPLGYNNAAVFSIGFYNVGPAYDSSHYHGHYYSAWTTVPHGAFGHGSVNAHAVNWDHGSNAARPQFTAGRAPGGASVAAARTTNTAAPTAAAPIRFAGTRAASQRSPASGIAMSTRTQAAPSPDQRAVTTPRYINRGSEIVRSQTGQPFAPRDATQRTAAQNGVSQGQARAWDHPSYRPPGYTAPATSGAPGYAASQGRAYDRAMPRQEGPAARSLAPMQARGIDQPSPRQSYQRPPMESPRSGGFERSGPPSGAPSHVEGRPPSSGGHIETHAPSGTGVARPRGRS